MTGLRERKKAQTRQHLCAVATDLFVARGFDAVTIAEIAEAAEVSVNTVYNYFPAKEDLFLPWEHQVDRPSRRVRDRAPGESAAEALLRELRRDIADRRPWVGFMERGYDRFLRVVFGSPTLIARLQRMQHATAERLADTLREETGAAPDDPVPGLVAGLLTWLTGNVFRVAGDGAMAGDPADEIVRRMLHVIAEAEALLGDRVMGYARRPLTPGGAS
ncbi:TetR/AcrR family transcriptional regulator [Streptomyces sp. RFCAC02]|uniref:TetR/AcrR family transcriptional regulator n=1 Tax=Streptomyces sp. RFCAC02 TaxID=2499143 RepID=UPI00101F0A4E|nr:TetR/AcrR family transcriptional regulator [Streptomyces sp. RFCAC02]